MILIILLGLIKGYRTYSCDSIITVIKNGQESNYESLIGTGSYYEDLAFMPVNESLFWSDSQTLIIPSDLNWQRIMVFLLTSQISVPFQYSDVYSGSILINDQFMASVAAVANYGGILEKVIKT